MLDFYGASRSGGFFYSSDVFEKIGENFTAISWHSFAVYKDNAISAPKVNFKEGSRRKCVDSRGYVHRQEVIAYPVVSVIIKDPEIINNIGPSQSADIDSVVSFKARGPVCIDLFVLPKGISSEDYLSKDPSSLTTFTSTNSIFIAASRHEFEPIQYNGTQFCGMQSININGWSCIFRISDPPQFTRSSVFSAVSIISYDLKSVASSILDRVTAYSTDETDVLKKTTFRERSKNCHK